MIVRTKLLFLIALVLILPALMFNSCAQKTTETTASHPSVPASPNDSIVTAKIIRVQEGEGTLPWVLTITIQTSQDVLGYPNITADQIGQQLLVRTMEDASPLKEGQIITAHLRFEGDKRSSFYYIWDIH
jgi:hypothetical protein